MDTATANRRALMAISEEQWQATVMGHAERAGWLVFALPDRMWRRIFAMQKEHGGHAHLSLGVRGFPDLVLLSPVGRLLFRELKREGRRDDLSEYQVAWRDRLLLGGHDWAVWIPSDLEDSVIPTIWGESERRR